MTYRSDVAPVAVRLEVHTHSYVRGGRYDRDGKWITSITHSHDGGDVPHGMILGFKMRVRGVR